jgi:hypothetical protein
MQRKPKSQQKTDDGDWGRLPQEMSPTLSGLRNTFFFLFFVIFGNTFFHLLEN